MKTLKEYVENELKTIRSGSETVDAEKLQACENVLNDVDIDTVDNENIIKYMFWLVQFCPLTPIDDEMWDFIDITKSNCRIYSHSRYPYLLKIEDLTDHETFYIDRCRFTYYNVIDSTVKINKAIIDLIMHDIYPIKFPYDTFSKNGIRGTVTVYNTTAEDVYISCIDQESRSIQVLKAFHITESDSDLAITEVPAIDFLKDIYNKEENKNDAAGT